MSDGTKNETTSTSSMPTGSSETTTTGNVAQFIKPEFYTPKGPLTVDDMFRDMEDAEREGEGESYGGRNKPYHQNKSLLLMPIF